MDKIEKVQALLAQEAPQFQPIVSENQFRKDTVNYLLFLQKEKAKLTATGNLSLAVLAKISQFIPYPPQVTEDGYPLRSEQEWRYVELIDILTDLPKLTFRRQRYRGLSRKGEQFLSASPLSQLLQLFFCYFDLFNWTYLFPYTENDEENPAFHLRHAQLVVVDAMLSHKRDAEGWVRFPVFAEWLRTELDLKMINYLGDDLPDRVHDCVDDVVISFFRQFGLVEYRSKPRIRDLIRTCQIPEFRLTPLGRALIPFLLPVPRVSVGAPFSLN